MCVIEIATWTLLIFLGYPDPKDLQGYQSYDECQRAGRYVVTHLALCEDREQRRCAWECIPGPKVDCYR